MKKSILAAAALAAGVLAAGPAAAQSSAPTPPCRDPWVSQAVKEVQGRTAFGNGEAGECNIQLYGARWGSYGELVGYVRQAFAAMNTLGLSYSGVNGQILDDPKQYSRWVSSGIYVGPRASAPTKAWVINLPSGNVMALDRRCRPGFTPNGPLPNAGCVKGGYTPSPY